LNIEEVLGVEVEEEKVSQETIDYNLETLVIIKLIMNLHLVLELQLQMV
jgi:hypothetical protein